MINFAAKLTQMFEEVEPDFRAATILKYRTTAEAQLGAWLQKLEGPEPKHDRFWYDATSRPEFVRLKPEEPGHYRPYYEGNWEGKQTAAKLGLYEADYAKAERHANDAVDYAKSHFISKQSKKLANATKCRRDGRAKLDGTLSLRSHIITGALNVEFKGDNRFTLVMDMIVNYRYQRGFKSFYQFPARFTNVVIAGETPKGRISEAWMSENFK